MIKYIYESYRNIYIFSRLSIVQSVRNLFGTNVEKSEKKRDLFQPKVESSPAQ